METIEMTRHDLAPHHRSLRKFPQRSQSLRVKSSSPSIQRLAPRWIGTKRCAMPSNRLMITGQYLIVQDISPSSSTLAASSILRTKSSRPLVGSSTSIQFNSMTLNRHRGGRSQNETKNTDSTLTDAGQGTSQTSTYFIDGSLPPSSIHLTSPDRKSQTGEHLHACSTFSEEDVSVEDEGVITSFTEDLEESDEEDYLELDDAVPGATYSQPRRVHLLRHPQLGLGISIQGGSEFSTPVIVAAVKADSPADKCRLIYVGDRLVSVNEVALDETTCHNDARRLLMECGDKVCLVLKHTQSVDSFRRRWRRRNSCASVGKTFRAAVGNAAERQAASDQIDGAAQLTADQQPLRPLGRSTSVTSLGHCHRYDLFLAGITPYVTYSDQLRDSSIEVVASDGKSSVFQFANEEICLQWLASIKKTIRRLTDDFISLFNKQYPQREHIFYMGWVSECLSFDSPCRSMPSQHPSPSRWQSRFLIAKGGHVYLFKLPPVAILNAFKNKVAQSSRRSHSGSSGSSLGSVGSSTSEASTSSSTHLSFNASTSTDLLAKSRKVKPDRLERANKDLERALSTLAVDCFVCHKCDFRTVKPSELFDLKRDCFMLGMGTAARRYFSTEDPDDLQNLQKAWTRANYYSVTKFKSKTFAVVLEDENVFGSLILDWRYGFTFYDPKSKQYLWSYKFHQLKSSCDDAKSRLSMTFVIDPHDSRITKTHVLQCSCLQILLYCIHAFLSAKVYSLYI